MKTKQIKAQEYIRIKIQAIWYQVTHLINTKICNYVIHNTCNKLLDIDSQHASERFPLKLP